MQVRPANGSVADGCCSSLDSDELKGQPRSQSAVAHSYRCVGIDAEWEPSDGFSPVTLLQLATRRKAFLVDMLWFCSSPPSSWAQPGLPSAPLNHSMPAFPDALQHTGHGHVNCSFALVPKLPLLSPQSSREPSADSLLRGVSDEASFLGCGLRLRGGKPVAGGSLPALSEREAALSDCLVALFSAQHIVKAGFGLQGDLKYLCRSFPHLPCFRCPEVTRVTLKPHRPLPMCPELRSELSCTIARQQMLHPLLQWLPVQAMRFPVKVKPGSLRVQMKDSLGCHWHVMISAVHAISSKSLVIFTQRCRASLFRL